MMRFNRGLVKKNAPPVAEEEKKQRPRDVPRHIMQLVPQEKIEILRDHFMYFDKDGTGLMSCDELGLFLRSFGYNPPEARLKEIIEEYDKDGNGDLSFGEFVSLWYDYRAEAEQEKELIAKAFEFLDTDGSKALSFSEFKVLMMEVGDALTTEELDMFFKLTDKNRDGILNFEEFVQFLYINSSSLEDSHSQQVEESTETRTLQDLVQDTVMTTIRPSANQTQRIFKNSVAVASMQAEQSSSNSSTDSKMGGRVVMKQQGDVQPTDVKNSVEEEDLEAGQDGDIQQIM